MKKRFAVLAACLLLLLAFSACGKKSSNNRNKLDTDSTVTVTTERVESVNVAGEKQKTSAGDAIYDFYTFIGVDSESVAITGFRSETKGKTVAGEDPTYVLCLEPHTVVVPQTLDGKRVVKIMEGSFRSHNEIQKLLLPETLTYIGDRAFADCVYLDQLTLPAAVAELGEGAFYGCVRMKTLVFAAQSELSVIPEKAFMNCAALTAIHIPGYVKTIEDAAFLGCTSVTEVTLAEGLETIGNQAFQNLNLAAAPALPSTLKTIGELNF